AGGPNGTRSAFPGPSRSAPRSWRTSTGSRTPSSSRRGTRTRSAAFPTFSGTLGYRIPPEDEHHENSRSDPTGGRLGLVDGSRGMLFPLDLVEPAPSLRAASP